MKSIPRQGIRQLTKVYSFKGVSWYVTKIASKCCWIHGYSTVLGIYMLLAVLLQQRKAVSPPQIFVFSSTFTTKFWKTSADLHFSSFYYWDSSLSSWVNGIPDAFTIPSTLSIYFSQYCSTPASVYHSNGWLQAYRSMISEIPSRHYKIINSN